MSDEIREVEVELRRMRDDAGQQKAAVEHVKKENVLLKNKNEYLVNKLKEASYVYGEAGKRLLYFINNQVNPVVERLNSLESAEKALRSRDKQTSEALAGLEKTMRTSFEQINARISGLAEDLNSREEKLGRAIKGAARRGERGDAGIISRLDNADKEMDKKLDSMKVSVDKKIAARMTALERAISGKLSLLRERNLLLGKDIDELRRFDGEIKGLDGRHQETIANVSQAKLEIGKLEQRVKSALSGTKTAVEASLRAMSADVDKRLAASRAELQRVDDKNLGEIKLQLGAMQKTLDKQLAGGRSEMAAMARGVNGKLRKSQAEQKSEFGNFTQSVEGRLAIMEKDIDENSKNHKDFEHAILDKLASLDSSHASTSGEVQQLMQLRKAVADLAKRSSTIEQRIESTQGGLMENVEGFKERFERSRIVMKNELEKVNKKIDHQLQLASAELSRHNAETLGRMRAEFMGDLNTFQGKTDMLAHEMERLDGIDGELRSLADQIKRNEESDAALDAKIGSVAQQLSDKSEREDMQLSQQIDVIKSEIKNRLSAAEARMSKENVQAFSKARQSLKADVHALREENAVLRSQAKDLQEIMSQVSALERGMRVLEKNVDDFGHSVDGISKEITVRLENEALRASKDMAGTAAKLKADLRDLLAREKESFSKQSAGLEAKFASLLDAVTNYSKTLAETKERLDSAGQSSSVNASRLKDIEEMVKGLRQDINRSRREYKQQLQNLVHDIEG